MSQISASNADSMSDAQILQPESDTLILNWEPKLLKVRGIHLWVVENDQDVIKCCKKQLSKVCVTYKFIITNYRTFQRTSDSPLRPTKAFDIHTFTGWKWCVKEYG